MEVVKGLLLVPLLSSMFMCVLCSRELNFSPIPFHQQDNVPSVVKGFDVKRYTGRWYEIARFPSIFEKKNAVDTRATYTLKDDGTLKVLNEGWVDGKRDYVEGTAYKADPSSDEAKLKVKFYVPPRLPIFPVVGDYWVLYLDAEYQNAVVGQPDRKLLWILSRKSHIDDKIYNQLVQKAIDEGYDVSKLIKTPQSDTPPQHFGGSRSS
ncbi:hypothetical protein BT93_C0139 [Corymbia citriodora subsp. variegata]|nr:hypothetical protein BT93_C0139 [Corymbia citriodora subsp. variegata]